MFCIFNRLYIFKSILNYLKTETGLFCLLLLFLLHSAVFRKSELLWSSGTVVAFKKGIRGSNPVACHCLLPGSFSILNIKKAKSRLRLRPTGLSFAHDKKLRTFTWGHHQSLHFRSSLRLAKFSETHDTNWITKNHYYYYSPVCILSHEWRWSMYILVRLVLLFYFYILICNP